MKRGYPKQSNAFTFNYSKSLMVTYGKVDSNNNDGTTNIELVTGYKVEHVKIPSIGFPNTDPLVGGLKYPSVGAAVRFLYPEDDINSGWIEPAYLNYRDSNVQSEIIDNGNMILAGGGWGILFDPETGKYTITNGDHFSLEIDPDTEVVIFNDFMDNKFTLNNNGVLIEDKNGNSVSMESGKVLINGNLEILQ